MAKLGFFKSLKKKITLKGAIRTVAKVGAQLPIVGTFLQNTANQAASASVDARQAADQAGASVQQVLTQQPAPAGAGGGFGGLDPKVLMIGAGALVLVVVLMKRR